MFTFPHHDSVLPVTNLFLRRRKDLSTHSTKCKAQGHADVKVCVTMWHEHVREMKQLIKSLLA